MSDKTSDHNDGAPGNKPGGDQKRGSARPDAADHTSPWGQRLDSEGNAIGDADEQSSE